MPDPDQTTTQPLPTNAPASTTSVASTPTGAIETKTVKPGYKTTEFWLTAAALLLTQLYASGVISPDGASSLAKSIAMIAGVLAALGYTVSRGAAKK